MKFSKPATTFDQQIDLLIERGMDIPDRDTAHHSLAAMESETKAASPR